MMIIAKFHDKADAIRHVHEQAAFTHGYSRDAIALAYPNAKWISVRRNYSENNYSIILSSNQPRGTSGYRHPIIASMLLKW